MSKITKEFKTAEEYYADTEYITNSQMLSYRRCPFFYKEKLEGNVKEYSKDYFDYGHGVDAILSGEDIMDKFAIGTASKKGVEELRVELEELEKEMEARKNEGKKPLKSQITKANKITDDIEKTLNLEGKKVITQNELDHIKQSAEELKSQPLYSAFDNADTQTIIATEIDGVKVKCMLDKLDLKNKIICDDKTTKSLINTDFSQYLQQLAWYRWIVNEVYGVMCDCYLAVVDKNKSKNSPWKRSSLFYATPERLDWQHEINMEELKDFLKAREDDNYPPVVEFNQNARTEVCFTCDYYTKCPHARQKEFILL